MRDECWGATARPADPCILHGEWALSLDPHGDRWLQLRAWIRDQRAEGKDADVLLRMATAWVGGRRVEASLIGNACAGSFGHRVIHVEDDALGAVLVPLRLIFALHDGKGIHY